MRFYTLLYHTEFKVMAKTSWKLASWNVRSILDIERPLRRPGRGARQLQYIVVDER